jgi:hypothetical protein
MWRLLIYERMKKVSLVVGAGVNKEIHQGIALGADLFQDISDRVTDINSPDKYLSKLLNKINIGGPIRDMFVKDITRYRINSDNPSIDDFLYKIETLSEFYARKEEYLKISKISIIFHVLGFEGTETQQNISDDIKKRLSWLNILCGYIRENIFANSKINLNIITFNYDRIVEYYLMTAFSNSDNILNFVNNNIHHVYGRIGCLKGLVPRQLGRIDEQEIRFGLPNDKIDTISQLTDHIKLIFEERNVSTAIKEIIRESDELYIMGYGFDYINNIKIGLDSVKIDSDVRINAYPSLNQTKEEKIKSFISNCIIETSPCSEFLKKHL